MSEKQTLYDDSIFYDLVHGEFAPPETLAFYEDKIALYGSPVLELACGSGAYVIPLAEKGVDVVGIDISDEMLSRAKEKAAARNVSLDLRKGDIRDFELNQKFPLILLLGNSLQHLLTREDVEKCFAAVKQHLTPNGRFIIEVFNPSLKILTRPADENVLDSEYETEAGKMTLIGRVNYDAATQINHIAWIYQNVMTGKSKHFSFAMRQFFPQEFDALLHYNGFQIEQKFGNRDGSPFESSSLRQIVVASLT
ncbi:MAG TPA: class I SAM-dependent methyltransferase [Pyrinomonadaceae bacterium]|jgi:SAM-dependent methyltransferase